MAQEKVRVVIEVRGGNVQAVYAGDFVEVVVVDWDNINASFDEDDRATVGAQVLHPEPEPQMEKRTEELVRRARQEEAGNHYTVFDKGAAPTLDNIKRYLAAEAEAAEDVGAGMCAECQRWAEECVCDNAPDADTPEHFARKMSGIAGREVSSDEALPFWKCGYDPSVAVLELTGTFHNTP